MIYKPKKNAYFTGVWNGETNIIIMSKHHSLEAAKQKAKQELKYDKKGAGLSLFKYVGDVEV